jgi:hypothetical protein
LKHRNCKWIKLYKLKKIRLWWVFHSNVKLTSTYEYISKG